MNGMRSMLPRIPAISVVLPAMTTCVRPGRRPGAVLRFALLHRLGQPLAHGRGPEALQMAGDFRRGFFLAAIGAEKVADLIGHLHQV
jgi:hypothetical protein